MQYKTKEYDQNLHDKFKALSVKQPHASRIANGVKTIELRKQNTSYRGNLLICSSAKPVIEGMGSGCSLCFVELYDVKKVSELTETEKLLTRVDADLMQEYQYAWFLRNPEKVIEFPVKNQLGIYNLVYTKDCIITYPDPKPIIEPERKMPWQYLLVKWAVIGWFIFLIATAIYFKFR